SCPPPGHGRPLERVPLALNHPPSRATQVGFSRLEQFNRRSRASPRSVARPGMTLPRGSALAVFHIGRRTIPAGRRFRVPLALLVLVLDDLGVSRDSLLLGGGLCGR